MTDVKLPGAPFPGDPTRTFGYEWRVLRALMRSELSLQYEDAALGYVWALLKPMATFTVLYVVFDRILRFGRSIPHFPLYLLLGVVIWTFFVGATTAAMVSVVGRGGMLRRIAISPFVIPLSSTLSAATTFLISLIPIAVFIAANGITPAFKWLLIIPLLLELYLLVVAFSLVLSALYVRFRDTRQLWEILSGLLFYLTPIVYPISVVPLWAQKIMLLNPLAQNIQDIRGLILYRNRGQIVTIRDVFHQIPPRLAPWGLTLLLLAASAVYFVRRQHAFAEQV